jgi:hypothetical protein
MKTVQVEVLDEVAEALSAQAAIHEMTFAEWAGRILELGFYHKGLQEVVESVDETDETR